MDKILVAEDDESIREELTALLRELVTLEERTDKGPETVKVVLAKEAEEWSR